MNKKRKNIGVIGVAFLLLLGVAPWVWAATYYVAPNGKNTHIGSFTQPWATPAYGARRLRPGDTLVIRSGRYVLSDYETDILRPPSGTPTQRIVIRGEPGGHVILACRNNLMAAVDLSGASHVTLENLEITHDPTASGEAIRFRDGIAIVGAPAGDIILSNLYIHHLDEFGIDAQDVEGLHVQGCRIEYCGFGAFGGPAGDQGGLRNITIQGCSLSWSGHYYRGGDGTQRPYDRPDGFGIEPSEGPILIEDTVVQHNYGDGLDSKASHTVIRRCLVANNSCDGVKLWGGGSRIENTLIYGRGDGNPQVTPWASIVIDTTQAGADFGLYNVTVDDALGGNYFMYVQYDHDVPVALTIRNCIFSGRGPDCPIWLRHSVSLRMDHVLFWFPACPTILQWGEAVYGRETIGTIGQEIRYGDPLFVSVGWGTEGDYHLSEASPAVDAGVPLTDCPPISLDGRERPLGRGYDLGAYEE